MANIITGTITGPNTPSGKISGRRFLAAVGEYGAAPWAATISLFAEYPDGSIRRATDATGTVIALNANEQAVLYDFGCPVTAWLEATAYTSGQIKFILGAETRLSGY